MSPEASSTSVRRPKWTVFQIGGWSKAEYQDDREIPPGKRDIIERVIRGELHENDLEVGSPIPHRLARAMTRVREAVHHMAGHALDQGGLTLDTVYAGLERADQPLEYANAHRVRAELVKFICTHISIAMEESIVNEVKHAHRFDPRKMAEIAARVTGQPHMPVLEVRQRNQNDHPFYPAEVPDPTEDVNLERPTGRGLLLMREFMDTVEFSAKGFNRLPGGCVHMTKRLHGFSDTQIDEYLERVLREIARTDKEGAKS